MGLDDPDLAERTFKIMDLDGDGTLAFTEFSSLVLLMFKDLMEDRMNKMIAEYDSDGNKDLDPEEMRRFINDITGVINTKGGALPGRSADMVGELQEASRGGVSYDQVYGRLLDSRTGSSGPSGAAAAPIAAVGTPLRRSGDVTPVGGSLEKTRAPRRQ